MSAYSRRGFLAAALATGEAVSAVSRGEPQRPGSHQRPNILLLFSDQHNAGVMGCAGHPDVKTPRLDQLAAEGVRFARAYCQDGVCAPSRASMLTGHYPRTTGVLYNPDRPPRPEALTTLHAHLKANGYRTAAFGKRHLPRPYDPGFDYTCTTLQDRWDPSDENYWDWIEEQGALETFERDWNAEFGHRFTPNRAVEMCSRLSELDPSQTMEAYTARKTMEYLRDARNHDAPFFAWCSFYRPHQPYTPLPGYAAPYPLYQVHLPGSLHEPAGHLPPLLRRFRRNEKKPWCLGLAAKDVTLYRRYIAYYYALVAEIDYHIGTVLDTLDAEGLADNTIVIYTSDHGDFVGHHGMIEKIHNGHNVYEDTLRVPFIMRLPGAMTPGTREDLVELVDLYPTLLELTGITPPAGPPLPGKSLVSNLRHGTPVGRAVAFSENYIMLTAIASRYKLGGWIERPEDGFPDLFFDREKDPLEMRNLHDEAAVRNERDALRAAMADFVGNTLNVTNKALRPQALREGSAPVS